MGRTKMVAYRKKHQAFFEAVNRAWIESMFEMEAVDTWVLQNPEEAILQKGGHILVAEVDHEPAAVLALKKLEGNRFEFTKMAVDQQFRRRGIGRQLLLAGFEKALSLTAVEVILYSNRKNEDAVRLYERLGFIHQEVEPGVYIRANVKMSISARQMQEMIRRCYSLIQ